MMPARKTRLVPFIAVLVISCAVVGTAFSVPIDGRAARELAYVSELINKPLAQRAVSEEDSKKYVAMLREGNSDMQLCAIHALAFASDGESLDVLRDFARDSDRRLVAGAAGYAVKVRDNRGRNENQLLSILCFYLGRCENPFERMFLANRIAVDFGEKGIWTILAAARIEPDPMVRCDMLYYLARAADITIAREVLSWEWDRKIWLADNIWFLMGALTPGRPKSSLANSSVLLLRELRAFVESRP